MSMFLLGPPPFFWSALSQEPAPEVRQVEKQESQAPISQDQDQQQFEGGLTVTYDSFTLDDETGIITLKGNVKATYDVTILTCEELELNEDLQEFTARKGVELTDPDGYLRAEELWGTWRKPPEGAPQEELDKFVMGRAKNAIGRIGNARFDAEEIIVHPGLWEMLNVKGTISSRDNAPYGLFARRVTLRPGKNGVAENLYLEILGQRLGPIPRYSFSLDRRVSGMSLPSIRQDREKGFGIGWSINRLLNDHSGVIAGYESFPGSAPKYSFELAYSPLTPDSNGANLNPRTDLGERADNGWFDNITVSDLESEQNDLRRPRLSYSIGSRWNEGASARLMDGGEISKAVELVYETGGELGHFGTFFQGRLQHIRGDGREPFLTRGLFQGTAIAPDFRLSDSLFIRTRADVFLTQSERGTYSWMRGSAGLVYQPIQGLSVGAAYVAGFDTGRPDFLFDPLYSEQAAHFRIDWRSGPYSVKYLYKYDLNKGEWYDREWEVSLVADAFEPFIQYRQFPSNYQIGVRFRIDSFIEKITSRDPAKKRSGN